MDDQRHHPYENIRLNIAGHAHYEYAEVARSYVPMHWHDALELIYILSGELTVETEQRRWQLHAGQCICISPYVLHATISLSGNTALLLRIPTEELGDFAPETRSRRASAGRCSSLIIRRLRGRRATLSSWAKSPSGRRKLSR